MTPVLTTSIGPITISAPTILASGILGISMDLFTRIYDLGAGAIVTKSLSTKPWSGYSNPTMIGVKNGGWLNAVGLSNPGVDAFYNLLKNNSDVPIIVSLVGSNKDDFIYMIKKLDNLNILAYELNLSCPHVEKVGLDVGDDPELVINIITNIKNITTKPIIAKIGLGTSNYLDTVKAACDAGVDIITAINTIRAMVIDIDNEIPILSNNIGGLSGSPIKTIAIRCVYEISSKYEIPIIGCGGISDWQDAIEFILAGASAIQIGSIIGSKWLNVFNEINNGILDYMKKKKFSGIKEMIGRATRS